MKDGRGVERHESQCSCDTCRELCTIAPCQGTADEMAAIDAAGYGDRLLAGLYVDMETLEGPYLIVGITNVGKGCPFHTSEGLCELHDIGLKPLEGRLANHASADHGLKAKICETFNTPEGAALFKKFDTSPDETMDLFKQLKTITSFGRLGKILSGE